MEVGERAIHDAHALPLAEADAHRGLLRLHALQDRFNFLVSQRSGPTSRADKSRYPGGVADQVPRLVVHDHLHEDVAGEDAALHHTPLPLFDIHLFFHRHDNAENLVLHPCRAHPVLQVSLDLVFVARVGVYNVPGRVLRDLVQRNQGIYFLRFRRLFLLRFFAVGGRLYLWLRLFLQGRNSYLGCLRSRRSTQGCCLFRILRKRVPRFLYNQLFLQDIFLRHGCFSGENHCLRRPISQ